MPLVPTRVTPIRSYRDSKGRVFFVSDGISRGQYWGVFQRKGKGSLQRYKSVPMHESREFAERMLENYARLKGWTLVELALVK